MIHVRRRKGTLITCKVPQYPKYKALQFEKPYMSVAILYWDKTLIKGKGKAPSTYIGKIMLIIYVIYKNRSTNNNKMTCTLEI
jgi:hypothetical protein